MLDLLDYRRKTFELYRQVRELGTESPEAYSLWIETRNKLFGEHSQSALLEQDKPNFKSLPYWDYNPNYRVVAKLNTDVEPIEYNISAGDDGSVTIRQIGQVKFDLPTGTGSLGVFWIDGYGGGVFIPFKDVSNGNTSYGGGRYLYDTIKGADLGSDSESLILDFNYSYHPSCFYNPRWICPLAPQQNRLNIAIEAGEKSGA